MANLRRLGDVAQMFLRWHLASQNQEAEQAAILQRQKEMAQQQHTQSLIQQGFQNPWVAMRLRASGMQGIPPGILDAMTPTSDEAFNNAAGVVDKAQNLNELPTDADVLYHLQPGSGPHMEGADEPNVGKLAALIKARTGSIPANLTTAAQATAQGPINVKNANFPTELAQQGDLAREQAYSTAAGTEQANAENFPAQLARKGEEGAQANQQRISLERGLNPIMADRARANADATQAAEWLNPQVISAKLDFEKQKRIGELAQVGDKLQAEEIGKKNAAVRGLLPVYQEYRNLAVKVANGRFGAKSPASANVVGAVSHIPVIGEAAASGLEAGHAAYTGLFSQADSKDIAELNRITDTLAQGMANAVLGNRGQTTENDRRTAKNILANSFTEAKSLQDLLTITDRMFTLLPTVAGQTLAQDPFATPAQILQQAADAAKQQAQQGAAPEAAQPSGLSDILARPRRQ